MPRMRASLSRSEWVWQDSGSRITRFWSWRRCGCSREGMIGICAMLRRWRSFLCLWKRDRFTFSLETGSRWRTILSSSRLNMTPGYVRFKSPLELRNGHQLTWFIPSTPLFRKHKPRNSALKKPLAPSRQQQSLNSPPQSQTFSSSSSVLCLISTPASFITIAMPLIVPATYIQEVQSADTLNTAWKHPEQRMWSSTKQDAITISNQYFSPFYDECH